MVAVIQRVSEAQVTISGNRYSGIKKGLFVLLGIHQNDTQAELEWLVTKLMNLRIFSDEAGKMNVSLVDYGGELLVVSQFTLLASTAKGNRPSFMKAAKPEDAFPLYEEFIKRTEAFLSSKVQTGMFGADMQVSLVNDGPVTIILDSADKK